MTKILNQAMGRIAFLSKLEQRFTPREIEEIEAAYVFSKYGHRGQYREEAGLRYFEHPKAVVSIIIDELKIYDREIIVTALLHDILEDSFLLSKTRIELNFGSKVMANLGILSKNVSADYYKGLLAADWKVILVKMCDRLHNLWTLGHCKENKVERQINETKEFYLPMADVLISKLPQDLKDAGEYLKEMIAAEIGRYQTKEDKSMNRVLCQKWEESERGWGERPDGYSLHMDLTGRNRYVDNYWGDMPDRVPEEYSRPYGNPYWCEVSEEVFARVISEGGVRSYERSYPDPS